MRGRLHNEVTREPETFALIKPVGEEERRDAKNKNLYRLSQLLRILRRSLGGSGSDHHHAALQRVVAASPGLPEDALLPLVALLGRRTLEVSAVQVGASAVAEPPAACLNEFN